MSRVCAACPALHEPGSVYCAACKEALAQVRQVRIRLGLEETDRSPAAEHEARIRAHQERVAREEPRLERPEKSGQGPLTAKLAETLAVVQTQGVMDAARYARQHGLDRYMLLARLRRLHQLGLVRPDRIGRRCLWRPAPPR